MALLSFKPPSTYERKLNKPDCAAGAWHAFYRCRSHQRALPTDRRAPKRLNAVVESLSPTPRALSLLVLRLEQTTRRVDPRACPFSGGAL